MIGVRNCSESGGEAGRAPGIDDEVALPEIFSALLATHHGVQRAVRRWFPEQGACRPRRRIVELVRTPVILAGGLGSDNVAEAIRAVRPAGVDSKTKTDRDGTHRKDLDRVRRFHAAAKSAFDKSTFTPI